MYLVAQSEWDRSKTLENCKQPGKRRKHLILIAVYSMKEWSVLSFITSSEIFKKNTSDFAKFSWKSTNAWIYSQRHNERRKSPELSKEKGHTWSRAPLAEMTDMREEEAECSSSPQHGFIPPLMIFFLQQKRWSEEWIYGDWTCRNRLIFSYDCDHPEENFVEWANMFSRNVVVGCASRSSTTA